MEHISKIESIKLELLRKKSEIEKLESLLQREMLYFKAGDVLHFFGTGYPDLKIITDNQSDISAIDMETGTIEYDFIKVKSIDRISCDEMDNFLSKGKNGYLEVNDILAVNRMPFTLKHRIPDDVEKYIEEFKEKRSTKNLLEDNLLEEDLEDEELEIESTNRFA